MFLNYISSLFFIRCINKVFGDLVSHMSKITKKEYFWLRLSYFPIFLFLLNLLQAPLELLFVKNIKHSQKGFVKWLSIQCKRWNYQLLFPTSNSTLFQRCLLVDMTSRPGTTSNQQWNNVVYFDVEIYNVEQRQINVVYFNVLIWTTLHNVETMMSFPTSIFTTLVNVKATWWKWQFPKRTKKIYQIEYTGFKVLATIFFTLLPILWGICSGILVKLQKLRSWKTLHYKNLI